ncbi:MAG: transcriptional regulator [Chloroflexi bacterium]|nr:MAG: transcriptional regulator [Chloroflexota bacterium]
MARPKRAMQVQEPEVCDDEVVHLESVRRARRSLPDATMTLALAGLFDALGDPTRLRIVSALAAEELCVCDLSATVGLSQSAVSHQLRLLRSLGLVRGRRDGRMMYYALDDEHVRLLLAQGREHIAHRIREDA